MPTSLDFLNAKVLAYKNTLDGKPAKEKAKAVSIHIAQQFNAMLEELKKEAPEVASHLPQPIAWNPMFREGPSCVAFLELEMMLNQVVAVLDLLREGR